MTFKRLNFGDSATMRSLEKLAIAKGLIKPDVIIEKQIQISADLTSNLLTLCEELKNSGMHKQANELELNFMKYKSAQYNVHKETGEDLINSAHPDGSVKMDFSGNHVVQTILDQHLSIMKVVNKEPTGKLVNASNIMNAVKYVLAQDVQSEEEKAETEANKYTAQLEKRKTYVIDSLVKVKDKLSKALATYQVGPWDGFGFDNFKGSLRSALSYINKLTNKTAEINTTNMNFLKGFVEKAVLAGTSESESQAPVFETPGGKAIFAYLNSSLAEINVATNVLLSKNEIPKSKEEIKKQQEVNDKYKKDNQIDLEDLNEKSKENQFIRDFIKNRILPLANKYSAIVNKEQADLNNPDVKLTPAQRAFAVNFVNYMTKAYKDLFNVKRDSFTIPEVFSTTKEFNSIKTENDFNAEIAKVENAIRTYNAYWK